MVFWLKGMIRNAPASRFTITISFTNATET
jgi:hypothetical protein